MLASGKKPKDTRCGPWRQVLLVPALATSPFGGQPGNIYGCHVSRSLVFPSASHTFAFTRITDFLSLVAFVTHFRSKNIHSLFINMHSTVFTLAAVVGLASAWTYPNCEPDNCYNEMVDTRFHAEAVAFCPEFLASTVTAASAIPTDFSNCGNDVMAVSSACSCITYTADLTKTPSATPTPPPPSTTSTSSIYSTTTESSTSATSAAASSTYPTSAAASSSVSSASSTYPASSYPASSSTTAAASTYPASSYPVTTYPVTTYPVSVGTTSVPMTTSTVYATSIYTVTSCAPTVTNCPAGPHLTTDIISLYTTVCPVSSAGVSSAPVAPTYPVYGNTTLAVATSYPVGTAPGVKPTASTTAPLTANDAGRVGGSVVAAAAALLAFAL